MNLNKHDAETDMEMDMTPMIDVVFLLIIFFMIITDMSQQDLEDLTLPIAINASPDKPDPNEWRPVLNIAIDGTIKIKREIVHNPEASDDFKALKEWMAIAAKRMEKAHFDKDAGTGPMIPDEPLLIRADQNTPFKFVQKVMEFCGLEGIQIWKVQLAASEDPATKEPMEF